MKTGKWVFLLLLTMCGLSSVSACNSDYPYGLSPQCGKYTCTSNADTSPTICNSACPNPCDLNCAHDNTTYRGCGDNCVMP